MNKAIMIPQMIIFFVFGLWMIYRILRTWKIKSDYDNHPQLWVVCLVYGTTAIGLYIIWTIIAMEMLNGLYEANSSSYFTAFVPMMMPTLIWPLHRLRDFVIGLRFSGYSKK